MYKITVEHSMKLKELKLLGRYLRLEKGNKRKTL